MAKKKKNLGKKGVDSIQNDNSCQNLPVGLRNLGNSCYQNVVVQCLSREENFGKFLRKTSGGIVLSEMRKLCIKLSSVGPSASLVELNQAIQSYSKDFSPRVQNDAHEFLMFILDWLQNEVPNERNLFDQLSIIREKIETVCLSCGAGGGFSSDQTSVLSVPLADGSIVPLQECIQLYEVSSADQYVCPECSTQDEACRKVCFSSLPLCLSIHLKRFQYEDGLISKDNRLVSCPFTLRLPEYANNRNLASFRSYQLSGFFVHLGEFSDSGHYVAYFKVQERWFKFDDAIVSEVQVGDLPSATAYVLFYSAVSDAEEILPEPTQTLSDSLPLHPYKRPRQDPDKKSPVPEPTFAEPSEVITRFSGENECRHNDSASKHDDDDPSHVMLYEWDDVPGAVLDTHNLTKYLVCELSRWLHCRNIRKGSSKSDMISQIRAHVKNKQSHILWSRVDGGYWLELKRSKISKHVGEEVIEEPILPVTGWRPFPSRDVPAGFNRGQVYDYLVVSHPGISDIVGKRLYASLGAQDSVPGSEKITIRSARLVDSDFVHAPTDNLKGATFYFVKAYVRASMERIRFFVWVVLSAVTGKVLSAGCKECMASSLNRCSHIGALLTYMLRHVEQHGHEAYLSQDKLRIRLLLAEIGGIAGVAISSTHLPKQKTDSVSSTGRPRTWALGSVKKDPGRTIRPEDYKKKRDERKRYSFDPRPSFAALHTVMPTDELIRFKYNLQRAAVSSGQRAQGFQMMPIRYDDFVLNDEDEKVLFELCTQMYNNLRKMARTDPFQIPGTEAQVGSDKWHQFRCLLFTASIARRVLGLTSISAKTNFLREHLWGVKMFTGNKATRYGQLSERKARREYLVLQREVVPTTSVEETGLWINRSYPMLGCSPDGIVRSQCGPTKVLEIKCPAVVQNFHPSDFDTRLTEVQQRNFPLIKSDGQIKLKTTHDHYYQVQMQMDIMNIRCCDYVVWSRHGIVIVPIIYDDVFWSPKRVELLCKHQTLLAPEYFLMRILRDLPVVEVGNE